MHLTGTRQSSVPGGVLTVFYSLEHCPIISMSGFRSGSDELGDTGQALKHKRNRSYRIIVRSTEY